MLISIGMQAQSESGTYEANGVTWKFEIADGEATITGETKGKDAFHGALNIPATVVKDGVTYPVTVLKASCFSTYSNATSATIPEGVKRIERYAFSNCTGLHGDFTIPST
ncbi:MAG TPA: leucine-rich repeat protein, partial [Prevotella sp.]